MKIRFTISLKLLIFILPLVCIPISAVGYFAIQESGERVNRLVRQEQRVAVKATANIISNIFTNCGIDLETISRLPILEDYRIARSFRLKAEAEFNHDNIVRLFHDFILRTPTYFQIRYIDHQGRELIKVRREGAVTKLTDQSKQPFFQNARHLKIMKIVSSEIIPMANGFLIHYAKPFYGGWKEFAGVIVIDLDFKKIIELVKNIHVGDRGYAFLIDQYGRNIAHPLLEPYQYTLETYPDPSLRELVIDMMAGKSGWKGYSFQGENKVAAFEPVKGMGWSLAVTISTAEFTREAYALRNRVIQFVLIAIVFTIIGVSILSYFLLRPVRNLVIATNRIADGDLNLDIPVQSRDELGDLTRSFNRMMRNLSRIHDELVRSEKLISLGRLSAGVAHEIRNPLNAIKGAIIYLQRKRSEDPLIKDYTRLVLEEIDRLSQFVTEFLYFARQAKPKRLPTDLNKLIQSTQNLFKKHSEEKEITFHPILEKDLPIVFIDGHQIEQVLVNLFINAIEAMPGGGKLMILTRTFKEGEDPLHPSWVKIKVKDTGVGIPREHLKNIFDPFFSTKETGTGLGLPISLGIIEAHGGTLQITSQPGEGTRVTIKLPIMPEKENETDESEEEKDSGS
ncbi:MAG: HAMP domain-containing protein [Deltaproteobacteria bacterium]|nr:HAMP domain-containing protein [Deltaproteobacteria bacterium]